MKRRFTEEQIVAILREGQTGQKTVEQLCKEQNIATPTYYGWKRKYGGMDEPDVKRLRDLENDPKPLRRIAEERDHGAGGNLAAWYGALTDASDSGPMAYLHGDGAVGRSVSLTVACSPNSLSGSA